MNYLIAILLPFVATLMCKKYWTSFVLLFLMITVIGYPIAVLIALLIVKDYNLRMMLQKQPSTIVSDGHVFAEQGTPIEISSCTLEERVITLEKILEGNLNVTK